MFSKILKKFVLTFENKYVIRIKRFEDIVAHFTAIVKIFYLIGGTQNVHYSFEERDPGAQVVRC